MTRELLTHSKRQAFLGCPRFYFHRHVQRLELIAKRPGRRRGTIFGDALQAARDHNQTDAALRVIEEAYVELAKSDVRAQDDADTLDVEQVKIRVMVEGYIAKYGMKPRREVEFYLPLRHPRTGGTSKTFEIAGKLDGLEVVGPESGRIIEDKLVSQLQKPMIDRLPLDAQTSEYVDALLSKGWSATVAYRHTRYPGINPTKQRVLKTKTHPAETLEQFESRLRMDVAERMDWYFDEQIVFFPEVHMEDYRAGRWGVARMIMNARLAAEHDWREAYPMNPSRCYEFGGCAFIPLCCKYENAIDRYEVVPENPELSRLAPG